MRRCLYLIVVALVALPVEASRVAPVLRPPLWVDADVRNIPVPKERLVSELYGIAYNTWLRHFDVAYESDMARHVPALNVNAWDEVPDSSWFTNRIGVRPMAFDDIVRTLPGVDPLPGRWHINRVNDEGYTPKFDVADAEGHTYVLKMDPPEGLERNSSAERICTLIAHAAGYNVPHDSIVRFRRTDLFVDEKSFYRDERGNRHPLSEADVDAAVAKLKPLPDRSHRGIASFYLGSLEKGRLVGRFMYSGVRKDDPNDIIPHEMRRELRGLRVIASWINHVDVGDKNAMDVWLEDHGRHYVRHYLMDLSALGSGSYVNGPYRVGHESIFDGRAIGLSLITLGAWQRPWERQGRIELEEIGYFTDALFDPLQWKPNYPNLAFERMDEGDAYWGAKIVTAFPDETIERLAAAGEFSRPEVTRHLAMVLTARRNAIGRYWLDRVTPLETFRLDPAAPTPRLSFRDLAVDRGYVEPPLRRYRFWAADLDGRPVGPVGGASASQIELAGLDLRVTSAREPPPDRYGRVPVARLYVQSNRRDGGWASPIEVVVGHASGSRTIGVLGWTHAPRSYRLPASR